MNVIHVKTSPCGGKGVLTHNHYRSDPNLGQGFVSIWIISISFQSCTTQLSLTWGSKIKNACNHPIHGKACDFKYFLIIRSHNNWMVISYGDDGINEVKYDHINTTLLYGNITNMSLIICK